MLPEHYHMDGFKVTVEILCPTRILLTVAKTFDKSEVVKVYGVDTDVIVEISPDKTQREIRVFTFMLGHSATDNIYRQTAVKFLRKYGIVNMV